MSRYAFKLPDLGEGTVEAEIVGWRVKPGDIVTEDDVIVEVMTEKAAVEVPAPVSGRVVSTRGGPGDMVPVGSELIVFETEAAPNHAPQVPANDGGQPAERQPAQDSAAVQVSGAGQAAAVHRIKPPASRAPGAWRALRRSGAGRTRRASISRS